MKLFFIATMMVALLDNNRKPVEVLKPNIKSTMYIAVDKEHNSQLLKSELTRNWYKVRCDDDKGQKICYHMAEILEHIKDKVNIKFVEDEDNAPAELPAYRFSKYQKWEKFPKKCFSYSTRPTMSVQYLIDSWFLSDFQDKLENKRRLYFEECTSINTQIMAGNALILKKIYPGKNFTPIEEIIAVYQYVGKGIWKKIQKPTNGLEYIPKDELRKITPVTEEATENDFFFATGFISGYSISGWEYDSQEQKDIWKDVRIPAVGLNQYLQPGPFPKVDVGPAPPWDQEYSFIPF